MKQLYFCRHAQAGESPRGDFFRELDQEGRQQAITLAKKLHWERIHPDLVLSSTAPRALQTAEIIAERLGYQPRKILTEQAFYEQDFEKLVAFLRRLDRIFSKVLIVGHNPTISDLPSWISGTAVKLSVAGHAAIKISTADWNNAIRFRSGWLKQPREENEQNQPS